MEEPKVSTGTAPELKALETGADLLATPYYPRVFSPEECQRILDEKDQGYSGPSLISSKGEENQKIRHSNSTFLPPASSQEWIIQRLLPIIHDVNDNCYQFDIQAIAPLQIIEYNENGHYDWHVDIGLDSLSTRKISMVVFLTPPEAYTGGRLKLVKGVNPVDFVPAQGSCIVFPSFLLHRVEPIRSGSRHTLVVWVHGPPYR